MYRNNEFAEYLEGKNFDVEYLYNRTHNKWCATVKAGNIEVRLWHPPNKRGSFIGSLFYLTFPFYRLFFYIKA